MYVYMLYYIEEEPFHYKQFKVPFMDLYLYKYIERYLLFESFDVRFPLLWLFNSRQSKLIYIIQYVIEWV